MGNDDHSIDNETTLARPKPRLVRTLANEETVTSPQDEEALKALKPPFGRLRKMGPILVVLLVVLACGPFISRFIDTYRAVVVDIEGDKMMIQEPVRPPRWVPAIDVKPVTVVVKDSFTWNPHPAEQVAADAPGLELAERWQSAYEGTIVEMRAPNAPGRGSTAVVETKDGRRFEVSLFAEHLATASVGRLLHKDAHTWDPVMLAPRHEPSGSFSLTPEGARLPNPQKTETPHAPTPAPQAPAPRPQPAPPANGSP